MELHYHMIRSARKTIAIQITSAGEVVVRCPNRMRKADVQQFVESKRGWIERHLSKPRPVCPPFTAEELDALAKQARTALPIRVAEFASRMGISYGRITIRSQRTRWGSCSGKGNLNFNCLLMLVPAEVRDYVIVHELCHRKELNHSARFWAEVEQVLPDYQIQRRWLKDHGNELIGRLP